LYQYQYQYQYQLNNQLGITMIPAPTAPIKPNDRSAAPLFMPQTKQQNGPAFAAIYNPLKTTPIL
jgi:hypothetical protein